MNKKIVAASLAVVAAGAIMTLGSLSTAEAKDRKIGVAERIQTFDTLDFDVFSNQKWDLLHESHTTLRTPPSRRIPSSSAAASGRRSSAS